MPANALFSPAPLPPGFMVVHANRLEDLRGLAVEWMRRQPLGPLENETILVQSNGIAQWLKLALAEKRTEDGLEGGLGIAAGMDFLFPARLSVCFKVSDFHPRPRKAVWGHLRSTVLNLRRWNQGFKVFTGFRK